MTTTGSPALVVVGGAAVVVKIVTRLPARGRADPQVPPALVNAGRAAHPRPGPAARRPRPRRERRARRQPRCPGYAVRADLTVDAMNTVGPPGR
ncbi:hypothetical protein ACIO93_29575 [Streptomyces sp. NPDC087903]|uniref:hypothetical protein n=1 Tax=Streptomyces sp. NPDC087903 TaxID=3365819 RepID=UPI00380E8AB1